MEKKVTLQEIARQMGITVSTVHKALYGKKGVSESRRKEIITVASELGYRTEIMQNNKTCRIAVVLPNPVGIDTYFYQFVWKGIQKRADELKQSSCELLSYVFNGSMEHQLEILDSLLHQEQSHLDGLITIIWDESRFKQVLDNFTRQGIKIFTVSSDAPSSRRISTIGSNPNKLGRLAAEYLGSVIHHPGRVIVIGTRRDAVNHAQVVRGFFDQMSIMQPEIQIIEIYESIGNPEKIFHTLQDFLEKFDDVQGIYINNARTTAALCDAIRGLSYAKGLRIIGSELFSESISAVREGVLHALIDQNPFNQGYKVLTVTYEHIAQGKDVLPKYEVPINLFLSSNLPISNDLI